LIKRITKDSFLPVLAIGGITAAKVEEVVKAGAAGVAVISAIAGAAEPKEAAQELMKALTDAWTNRDQPVSASA
jgi:thiamine-phosphate pyrophosphorylase